MRKFMVIALPIVTLVLFVMVMLSSNILKQPLGNDDNIPQSIETVVQDINHENWEAANQNTENLNRVWDKVVTRVQFSAERNELDDLTMNIARLKGAIQAKDKAGGLTELSEAYEHWKSKTMKQKQEGSAFGSDKGYYDKITSIPSIRTMRLELLLIKNFFI